MLSSERLVITNCSFIVNSRDNNLVTIEENKGEGESNGVGESRRGYLKSD